MKKAIHPNHTAVPRSFCRLPDGYGVVKIGVSGSADLTYLPLTSVEIAKSVGREIALQGGITVTGATSGFPMFAAAGAKDECGFSLGFSPAINEHEHVMEYKLPREYMDAVVYTGFGYTGRDLIFVRACDALIVGPGRIGTLNEFSIAFETTMPMGILQGVWDTDELLQMVIESSHRANPNIVFDSDPQRLVARLIEMVGKYKQETEQFLQYGEHTVYTEGRVGDVAM